METPKLKSRSLEINPFPGTLQPTCQWSSRLQVKVCGLVSDPAASAVAVSVWKPLASLSQWHRHVSQSESEKQS